MDVMNAAMPEPRETAGQGVTPFLGSDQLKFLDRLWNGQQGDLLQLQISEQ